MKRLTPHRQGRRALVLALVACGLTLGLPSVSQATGVTVTDLGSGASANGLAESLVGGGVSISNVTLTGDARGAGMFTSGATSVGFESGIVLSSGKVQSYPSDEPCSRGVEGPNTCYESTGEKAEGPSGWVNATAFNTPGDTELSGLSGFETLDASVLEFDFVPQHSTAQFSYVFSSEEYSDYSNTAFNDVFAFYINGTNCALVPGTSEPVEVDTINNGNDQEGNDPTPHHPELFRDNVRPAPSIASQMDGLTSMLTCTASVTPGQTNHMKLAIADASDPIFDSAVFIGANSLVSGTQIATTLTGGGRSGEKITVLQGTAVSDHGILSGAGAPSATGTVQYKVYSDNECKNLVAEAGTVTVAGGTAPASTPQTLGLGTYYWQASYSGDEANNASKSECGAEVETVASEVEEEPEGEADPTTVVTSLTGGNQSGPTITVPEGTSVFDRATLRGSNAVEATGTVAYAVYSDSACTKLVAAAGSVNVSEGVVPASNAQTLPAGTYYWQASYGGDKGNLASKSACGTEVETVGEQQSREAPEFGRCLAVPGEQLGKKVVYHGGFANAGCTKASATHSGKYEWSSGVVKPGFTATLKPLTVAVLETVSKVKVKCTGESASGAVTGPKSVGGVVMRFTGCQSGTAKAPTKCTTPGLPAGELETGELEGMLGIESIVFVEGREVRHIGLDLRPSGAGPFMEYSCTGGGQITIDGSVIARVKAGKMLTSSPVTFRAKEGRQIPESFEGGVQDVLLRSLEGEDPEQLGLKLTALQSNEEAVEINPIL